MNHWLNQLRECELIGRVENIRGAQTSRFWTWVFRLGAAAGAGAGVQCTGGRSGLKGQRWQMGVGAWQEQAVPLVSLLSGWRFAASEQ